MRVVVNGAGAAAIACAVFAKGRSASAARTWCFATVMGAVTVYREDINPDEARIRHHAAHHDAGRGAHDADVFLGVSKADTLTPEMLRTMAENPIGGLANPDPEITIPRCSRAPTSSSPRAVRTTRTRSTTCWALHLRGALDVRATKINEEMKLAAAHALAELTPPAGSDHGPARLRGREARIRRT